LACGCRCTQIKTYSWDNAQVVLVGNKCDLEYERVVSAERGRRLADQLGTITRYSSSVTVSHLSAMIGIPTEAKLWVYRFREGEWERLGWMGIWEAAP